MKPWHAVAVALLVGAALGYRIVALERRVDELTASEDEDDREGAGTGAPRDVIDEHDERLQDVEADVDEMRASIAALQHETDKKADIEELDRKADPDRILEVVAQEVNRVRDRQLDYQRERWEGLREQAAADFSQRYGLTQPQSAEVRRLLVGEVQHMIDILRSQDSLENPEQAVSDWNAMLEETDRTALRVLTEKQAEAWALARALERTVWMPWLRQ